MASNLTVGTITAAVGEEDTVKIGPNLRVEDDVETGIVKERTAGEGIDYIVSGTGVHRFIGKRTPGTVIEKLVGVCNGTTVHGYDQSYTLEHVTDTQTPGETLVPVTGSTIDYTPPPYTRTLVYRFHFHWGGNFSSGNLWHMALEIDGTQVVPSRHTHINRHSSQNSGYFEFVFPIVVGAETEDLSNGIVGTWSIPKTLRVIGRRYSSAWGVIFHDISYWDGTGSSQVMPPVLTIEALA